MNYRKQQLQLMHASHQNYQPRELGGRLPPQAIEIEEAVLGVIMLQNDALDEVLGMIKDPEVFYKEHHQQIYIAICNVHAATKSVDLLTVTEELIRLDKLEIVGGPFAVTKLTMNVVSSAHIIAHARILLEKHAVRSIIRTANAMLQQAYESDVDAFELIENSEREIMGLSLSHLGNNELIHISKPVQEFRIETEHKIVNKIKTQGIMSGINHIDSITNGWQNTDLIILAARPSVGKTAFALNLAVNAARQTKRVAIFSLEMSVMQLVERLMAMVSGVKLGNIKNPSQMVEKDIIGLSSVAIPEVEGMPLYFDDKSGLSVSQLKSKCRRLKSKHGLDMIIIDYLQLMNGGTKYRGNREQEISEISRELKRSLICPLLPYLN